MSKFRLSTRALCALVLALALSACGGKNEDNTNNQTAEPVGQSSGQQSAANETKNESKSEEKTITPNLAQHQQNVDKATLDACSKLSQADCLKSANCVVDKKPSGRGYQCRANQDRCEQGFVQEIGKDSCKSAEGCFFAPGSCFCPEGVECICGGGHPPMCASEPIVSDADSSEF